jgi:hypothetical protein
MNEKEVLIKAAFAAVKEMEQVADAKCFTFGSALNLVFNAVLKSGTVEITQADIDALKAEPDSAKSEKS